MHITRLSGANISHISDSFFLSVTQLTQTAILTLDRQLLRPTACTHITDLFIRYHNREEDYINRRPPFCRLCHDRNHTHIWCVNEQYIILPYRHNFPTCTAGYPDTFITWRNLVSLVHSVTIEHVVDCRTVCSTRINYTLVMYAIRAQGKYITKGKTLTQVLIQTDMKKHS